MKKLWGGRFEGATLGEVERFSASIVVDIRLWDADITASIAHARMLGSQGILAEEESRRLVRGLEAIRSKRSLINPDAEDVHSEIERLLTEEIGDVAGKLHTARSRNDQVVTATRLWLRQAMDELSLEVRALQKGILGISEKNTGTALPGLTHFQHAQPVSLAHHLMAYFWMLERDYERLGEARRRVNVLPLGSAALAGTGFPLHRESVAAELGFDTVTENSLDAVSDRDFVIEVLGALNLIQLHLSRLAEELVVWSSPEFGFVSLSDGVTTGSSIMPQKKNPDVAELIRGKSGRVVGALMGASMMMKALPLSYNRDLQEDKGPLFDGMDTVRSCVNLMRLMLAEATFHTDRMHAVLKGDFSNATDLADFLATKGITFRAAHEIVGQIVRHCLSKRVALEDLSVAELKTFSPHFDERAKAALKVENVLGARTSRGGTAPSAVLRQIEYARERLK